MTSAPRARSPLGTPRPAKDRCKEVRERALITEDVLQVVGCGILPIHTLARLCGPGLPVEVSGASTALLPLLILRAQRIVLLALLGIGQHLVGFVNGLKLLLSGFIPWIHIGMILPSELAERLPDRLLV